MPYLVQTFVANYDVVSDQPIGDEGTLRRRDDFVQNLLKSISNCFSYNSIDNIAQTNRPEVCYFPRLPDFWYQSNVSVI